MAIKLKPCPLCGGRVKCGSTETTTAAYSWVSCFACGLTLHGRSLSLYFHCKCPEFRAFRNEVREKWNKRINNEYNPNPSG